MSPRLLLPCVLVVLGSLGPCVLAQESADPDPTETDGDEDATPTYADRALQAATIGIHDPSGVGANLGSDIEGGAIEADAAKDKKSSFVAAPIPLSTSTIGSGFGVVAAYTFYPFKRDDESPPSTLFAGGLYTDNESWGVAGGGKVYWNEDRWRFLAGVGVFDIEYQFFGIGSGAGDNGRSVDLQQDGTFALVETLRKIGGRWYGGIRYQYLLTSATIDLGQFLPGDREFPLGVEIVTSSIAGRFELDTRDDQFAPFRGTRIELQARFARKGIGSDYDYERYDASWNAYWNVRANDVVAARVYGCGAGGNAPFFELCSVARSDLRGYTGGRYRDKLMYAVQTEYRWNAWRRFDVAGFVGVASVAPSFSEFPDTTTLPAGGIGVRFRVSGAQRLGIRMDYAWGKDDEAFYVAIGEAF